MGDDGFTMQIFNEHNRAIRRKRAARRKEESFLLIRAAEDAADKIGDVNRRFEHILVIGLPAFRQRFEAALDPSKRPDHMSHSIDWPQDWSSYLSSSQPVDAIISGLVLQSYNHLPEALIMARQVLKEDGFFLSAIIGDESLKQFREILMAVDGDVFDGVFPRVAPMIGLQQAGALLQMSGFNLPVIERDHINVTYKNLQTLVNDLRDIGETGVLKDGRNNPYPGRDYLKNANEKAMARAQNGRVSIDFDIIWMSGWSPHPDQPKPLKPGSAQMKLSDAVNRIKG